MRALLSGLALAGLVVLGAPAACGGGSSGPGSGGSGSSSGGNLLGSRDSGTTPPVCPAGLQCNVPCTNGGATTISGTVLDPAGKNPLYNVAVYVPENPLQPLPRGVVTGDRACDCGALFTSGSIASATTAVDGTFKITNAPVGDPVALVVQVGKWRRQVNVKVTACQDNPQPRGSLALPATIKPGDTVDNMPDIAVSTGQADSLECLMLRMGLPASEYVAGSSMAGHVHVFSGGDTNNTQGFGRGEIPPMKGAPPSSQALWALQSQLMPYDVVLLSCEGGETYAANPQVLEAYLDAGGRVFASHYHYSWFSGPSPGDPQSYVAPADWGFNLAQWTSGGGGAAGPASGTIVKTLNGSTRPFYKGQALAAWLADNGALGQSGVPAQDLALFAPRYDAQVSASNKLVQPWITSTVGSQAPFAMYFSFDTPVNAPAVDGGPPAYCGRAVYSDLHVGAGNPAVMDKNPPPGGCVKADLSPQEKALEFMLFDLSSCVQSDAVPPIGMPGPQQ